MSGRAPSDVEHQRMECRPEGWRFDSRQWLLWGGFWLLYLAVPMGVAVAGGIRQNRWLLVGLYVGMFVLFAATYLRGFAWAFGGTLRRRMLLLGALAVQAIALVLVVPGNATGALIYVMVASVFLLSRPAALTVVGFGVLLGGLWSWAISGPEGLWVVLGLAGSPLAVLGVVSLMRRNLQLRELQAEVARLAVAQDRERLSRDLHDVLSHSMTTITVKSSLARMLLQSGRHERAAAEIADVEQLARQVSSEVRSTVSGYRVASLAAELAGARVALDAAGIAADLPHAVDDVPPERQEAFAHVVREAVTNVLRHSNASTVRISLGADRVEVLDNGAVCEAPEREETIRRSPEDANGSGLRGLRERIHELGGTLEAGQQQVGYRLVARAPEAS